MTRTALLLLMSLVSFGSCLPAQTPSTICLANVHREYPMSSILIDVSDFAAKNPLTAVVICIIMIAAFITFILKNNISRVRVTELLEKEKQLTAILEKKKLEERTKQEETANEDRYQELLEKERQLTALLEKEKLEEKPKQEEGTQQKEESWDTPKSGDRSLLFFISEVRNIFSQMSTFTNTWTTNIDNLDDFYGIDCEMENFHHYMIRLTENGTKLVHLEDTLKMEDFSNEDWAWSMEVTKMFDHEGCGFVEGVGEMVEYIEEYAASQKEYMDTVTNKTVIGLNKKLVEFVKNGRAFVKSVEEKDAIEADFDVVPMT